MPDLTSLIALQEWLELSGERRVVIPFSHALADLVPHSATRMRRDFPQLLQAVKTIAMIHQMQREKDDLGRIVASVDDYASARWLLEEVFTTTVHDGVTPAIRETVEAVAKLSTDFGPVSEQALVKELGLAKSTISYRVKRAIQGGYLVNQTTQRNQPAQLIVGSPLPDGCPLPTVEEVAVCIEDPKSDSNLRTRTVSPAMQPYERLSSNNINVPIEPDSNPDSTTELSTGPSYEDVEFEEFERDHQGITHTIEARQRLPWDSFLDEVENDG